MNQTLCQTNTQLHLENLVDQAPVKQSEKLPLKTEHLVEDPKVCSRCKKCLPRSSFHKNRTTKDGLARTCKFCKFITNKKYFSSAAGKKALSGQTKRKWIRVKQKVYCRNLVNGYIALGKITKGACSVCGTHEEIEAHHEDYSKPFDIMWLCRKHHNEIHGKTLSKTK